MKAKKTIAEKAAQRGYRAAKGRMALAQSRELTVELNKIKNGLVREFGLALGGHNELLRSALNEAEALAWQTPYPHLVFPVLAEEKASAVNHWAARQRRVERASREIALAV